MPCFTHSSFENHRKTKTRINVLINIWHVNNDRDEHKRTYLVLTEIPRHKWWRHEDGESKAKKKNKMKLVSYRFFELLNGVGSAAPCVKQIHSTICVRLWVCVCELLSRVSAIQIAIVVLSFRSTFVFILSTTNRPIACATDRTRRDVCVTHFACMRWHKPKIFFFLISSFFSLSLCSQSNCIHLTASCNHVRCKLRGCGDWIWEEEWMCRF